MNKKLIVSAMGLVLAGVMGASTADIKLYGQIDLSINRDDPAEGSFQQVDTGVPPAAGDPQETRDDAGDDDFNMRSNNSALGIKGSEDLGNGLSAFFKIEYQTDVASDNNGDGWTGRDQYVGLKMERFGKLTAGTMSTAYKSPGSKIDVAYRTSLQSRVVGLQSALHRGKGENGQGRTTSTLRYDSPSWAGFSLMGTYNFDTAKEDANDDDTYSIGVEYKGGNFWAAASYIDTQADPNDTSAAQFLAKYIWNDWQFHGIYEYDGGLITSANSQGLSPEDDVFTGGAEDDGAHLWSIGTAYTIGNNILFADYGQGDDSDGSDGIEGANPADGSFDDVDDYDAWRIGAIHKMSKRTFVYAGYGQNDPDDDTKIKRASIGMRHHF